MDGAPMSTSNNDHGLWQNPPAHYAMKPEPIEVIEGWNLGFHLGTALAYIARAGRKGSRLEDLEKAKDYLEREIVREKQREEAEKAALLNNGWRSGCPVVGCTLPRGHTHTSTDSPAVGIVPCGPNCVYCAMKASE